MACFSPIEIMRGDIRNKWILLVAVFAVVAISCLPIAHSQRPTGPLPDTFLKIVETKQETIKQVLDRRPESEWAGNYYSQDGLTAKTPCGPSDRYTKRKSEKPLWSDRQNCETYCVE